MTSQSDDVDRMAPLEESLRRRKRYVEDARYHARVFTATKFLENWDSRRAGEQDPSHFDQAMDLIDALDSIEKPR